MVPKTKPQQQKTANPERYLKRASVETTAQQSWNAARLYRIQLAETRDLPNTLYNECCVVQAVSTVWDKEATLGRCETVSMLLRVGTNPRNTGRNPLQR